MSISLEKLNTQIPLYAFRYGHCMCSFQFIPVFFNYRQPQVTNNVKFSTYLEHYTPMSRTRVNFPKNDISV